MNLRKIVKGSNIAKYFYFKLAFVINYVKYLNDYIKFNRLLSLKTNKTLFWKNRYVCLDDKTSTTSFDTHYVYHTAWAARKLKEIEPKKHIDISSSIYFNAIVSAFVSIDFYDFRPVKINLSGLSPYGGDLFSLPFLDNSISSLSCMHVLEHIGLGRYGDKLDPEGDVQAVTEIKRVLASNGNLLIVVPVGKATINFNAHRVYGYNEVISLFSELSLKEFTLLTDDITGPDFITNASPELVEKQNYGCGCFWFQKLEKSNDNR